MVTISPEANIILMISAADTLSLSASSLTVTPDGTVTGPVGRGWATFGSRSRPGSRPRCCFSRGPRAACESITTRRRLPAGTPRCGRARLPAPPGAGAPPAGGPAGPGGRGVSGRAARGPRPSGRGAPRPRPSWRGAPRPRPSGRGPRAASGRALRSASGRVVGRVASGRAGRAGRSAGGRGGGGGAIACGWAGGAGGARRRLARDGAAAHGRGRLRRGCLGARAGGARTGQGARGGGLVDQVSANGDARLVETCGDLVRIESALTRDVGDAALGHQR